MTGLTDEEREKFGDIWYRARHNAMANHNAIKEAEQKVKVIDRWSAFFIMLPITAAFIQQVLEKPCFILTGISILGSLLALFFTLISPDQNYKQQINTFLAARSLYTIIAQKARRAENPYIENEEKKYLLRSLEEMFEMAKFNNVEPCDDHFRKAKDVIRTMTILPFGLKEKLNNDCNDE